MLPLASVGDLSDWIGEPIASETDFRRAELALKFASAVVRRASRCTWVDGEGALLPVPDDVMLVTLASAARGYTNPDGFIDESLDDWRGRKPEDAASFALTTAEKELLAGYGTSRRGGIGTVSTTRGDIGAPNQAVVVNGPDPMNPWWDGSDPGGTAWWEQQ